MQNKFKVGDKVRRIEGEFNGMEPGDIGTISQLDGYNGCRLKEYIGIGNHCLDKLELVEARPQYKADFGSSNTGGSGSTSIDYNSLYRTSAGEYLSTKQIADYHNHFGRFADKNIRVIPSISDHFILTKEEFKARYSKSQNDTSSEPIKNGLIKKTMDFIKKSFLSAEDKKLIKAGYLSENLELTQNGAKALQFISFEANKSKLVAMAEEQIAEVESTQL